jgi:hypothetical protein
MHEDRERHLDEHIGRLRGWRNRSQPDLSLRFLEKQFQREVARPHKQLGPLAEAWREKVPAHLVKRTALQSLRNGVLKVHVADSATLWELDQLLRAGLEQQLRQGMPGTLRRVRLACAPLGDE